MPCYGQFYSRFYDAIEVGNQRVIDKYVSDFQSGRESLNNDELNDLFQEACMMGNLEVAKALHAEGADINSCDQDSKATALSMAVAFGCVEVVDWLILNGADANIPNIFGTTPLHFAARNLNQSGVMDVQDQLLLIQKLIAAGADINAKALDGDTPLIGAVRACQFEAVYALLRNGADKHVCGGFGETAMDIARNNLIQLSNLSYEEQFHLEKAGAKLTPERAKQIVQLLSLGV